MKIHLLFGIIGMLLLACSQPEKKDPVYELSKEVFAKANVKAMLAKQIDEKADSFYSYEFARIHREQPDSLLSFAYRFSNMVESGKHLGLPTNELSLRGVSDDTEGVKPKVDKDSVLKKYKPKFKESKDEFKQISFFYHKRWGDSWLNRKALIPVVNSDGFAYLVSNYHAESWLFHTNVTVLVNGEKYQSEIVETYDPKNKTNNSSGFIWENITYMEGQDIIRAIAENHDKPVKVRFNGREFYDDITLSSKDKLGFKESWDFAQALKQ